ncbi:hypothetical protein [Cellulomonas sp. ICMP 17802]|uniref:hypothetical protein n=1 Tax=Cellulomonas sp. ICMP 17802 TaxID=3239199 RepID=UPI00351BD4CE
MPTEKTPRPAEDETAVQPIEETPVDETAADDTAVLPVEEAAADEAAADDTAALPVEETAADDTVVLPVEESAVDEVERDTDTTVLPTDQTRPLPVGATSAGGVEEPVPAEAAAPIAATEASAPTSPIGALYAPTDRPERVTSAYPAAGVDPTATAYAGPTAAYAPADRVDPVGEPAAPVAPVTPPRRRLRVGTVVWGLVIAAIGVGLLAWAAGVAIDLQLAMIVLLAVAGTALLVGSIVSGARNARR